VDSTIKGSQGGIQISPMTTIKFVITGPATAAVGTTNSVMVIPEDVYGNLTFDYTGTVHFTSTDGQAVLPANYTFTGADIGGHTFSVILKTEGNQQVTATDTVFATRTGTADIVVTSGGTSSFTVTGFPTSQTAGVAGSIVVVAKDALGNITTGYRGTVHFSSTDVQAVLPADYTFVAGDAGQHSFPAVTLKTAGSQSVTITDTTSPSITGSQSGISVTPAATASLLVLGYPNPSNSGIPGLVTVVVRDAFGNSTPGYVGTVHFTSTDVQAILPANYTFTAGDAGLHNFLVTLKTTGSQAITATDTVSVSITGSQIGITILAP
jgi:hypothetical protein